MKRRCLGTVIIFMFVILLVITQHFRYPIKPDNSNLKKHILEWANRNNRNNEIPKKDVQILDWMDFENRRHASILLEGQLGEVRLIKGINGRYMIESSGHGTGNFRYRVEEGKKEKHFIFAGKNTDLLINKISFILEGEEYTINVPKQEYFMVAFEVNNNIESIFPEAETLRFYDDMGKDITFDVERNTLE